MRHRIAPPPRRWLPLLTGATLALAASSTGAADAAAPRGVPVVRLSSAPEASEVWNLTARFDGGYRLFTWFFITNEGPGERNTAALWYLIHPDGRVAEFRNGRQEGRWRLSPDRGRIDIASSSLDLRGPLRRVAIDSTSQRVKIDLQFPAADPPPQPVIASPPASTLRTETLQVASPIAGTIWEYGMPAPLPVRGTVTLTHAWMDESVPSVLRRRIEFVADQPELAAYLSDITTPSGDDRRWLALQPNSAPGYQTSDLEVTLAPATTGARADHLYPIPEQLRVQNGRLTLDIRPQRVVLRTDPLDAVPQPFRFLFSLRIQPLWVWLEAAFHLHLAPAGEGPPLDVDGRGLLAVDFVNPVAP